MTNISFITIFTTIDNKVESYFYNNVEDAINHKNLFEGDDFYKSIKVVSHNWETNEDKEVNG